MDAHTFTTLVDRERRGLVRYAAGIVGPDDADDVVQVALLRAWMYDAPLDHPRAFVYRVVRTTALNHLRTAHATHPAYPLDDWHGSGRDVADIAAARAEARAALDVLATLPPARRDLFLRAIVSPRGAATSGAERQSVWRTRDHVRRAVRGGGGTPECRQR